MTKNMKNLMVGLKDIQMDQTATALSLSLGLIRKKTSGVHKDLEKQLEIINIESTLKDLLVRYLSLELPPSKALTMSDDIDIGLERISFIADPWTDDSLEEKWKLLENNQIQ